MKTIHRDDLARDDNSLRELIELIVDRVRDAVEDEALDTLAHDPRVHKDCYPNDQGDLIATIAGRIVLESVRKDPKLHAGCYQKDQVDAIIPHLKNTRESVGRALERLGVEG